MRRRTLLVVLAGLAVALAASDKTTPTTKQLTEPS
jgi:hypothetical protein